MKTRLGGIAGRCAAMAMAIVLAAGSAHAQSVVWASRPNIELPPPGRSFHAMAYDSARAVTVMFGGMTPNGLGDTWEWNGVFWTQRASGGPSSRHQAAMAYDAARAVTVLFGGWTYPNGADTWEWNGSVWTQRMVSGPSARRSHAMAYDSFRGVVLLFGGVTDDGAASGETWEWDGTTWTQRSSNGPSPRHSSAMAYDAARRVTLLFGGANGPETFFHGDTWEWNGSSWTQRFVANPSARKGHVMAYDAVRGATLLFGGMALDSTRLNDTWVWNGSAWTQHVVASPSGRAHSTMAYDATRGVCVLFGGSQWGIYDNNETWTAQITSDVADCTPRVTQQPNSVAVPPTTSAIFSITAISTSPLTYQWRRNGSDLANAPTGTGSVVTGADTATLTISYVSLADNGSAFDCVVSNSCGSKQSNPAGLAVVSACPADFNHSGIISVQDIFDFLAAYFAGCP